MKILLLNDNPVVNKLVTLSAQKTSDELESVSSIDEIQGTTYDLLVVDDTLYSEDFLNELNKKVNFERSLYICSRDSQEIEFFTATLRKPFLPTELVEMFVTLGKNTDEVTLNNYEDDLDLTLEDDEGSLDDFELDLPDEDDFDESILDDGDVKEVQSLLDDELEESDELEFDLDEELEESLALDLEDDSTEELEDSLDLELEEDSDEDLEESLSLEIEDDSTEELEDSLDLELEEDSDEDTEELTLEDDIESKIEDAVSELSEEDLSTELDADDLSSMAISGLDSLTSNQIKEAVGEEVTEEDIVEELPSEIEEETTELAEEIIEEEVSTETQPQNKGVEALKTLLTALSDKDVVAALDGMKININITLGDN